MDVQRLGATLVKAGFISNEQLAEALEEQKFNGLKLGSTLINLGFVQEEELVKFLSKRFNVPSINLSTARIGPEVIKLLPADIAVRHQVVPVRRRGRMLILAMLDPGDIAAMDDVKFATNLEIMPTVAAESAIKEALDKYYSVEKGVKIIKKEERNPLEELRMEELGEELEILEMGEVEGDVDISQLISAGGATPIVSLVNYLLTEATLKGASDIHIEPYEKLLRVRFRIDGMLREIISPSYRLKDAITSRIKIMTGTMDIAERRVPQDGRIKVKVRDKVIDLRVSIIPTLYGEKCVMRILDKSALMLDMADLGFEKEDLDRLLKAIAKPYGIVLVTGPTGSGKSTTLYSALNRLNTEGVHILTVEDPVEYNLMGVNQVQVNEDIGLNFSAALRAFLRQSPNIIMVGEIRDTQTAEIAVRAALTGHMVLSTIHTNDAPSTVNRLVDMGIEPFLVSSSLNLIQAQRLVRKICSKCKSPTTINPKLLKEAGIDPAEFEGVTIYEGKGCEECGNTGAKGRIAIFEVMDVSPQIREMILKSAITSELREVAQEQGMTSLREDAMRKLKRGLISIEEVIRETSSLSA